MKLYAILVFIDLKFAEVPDLVLKLSQLRVLFYLQHKKIKNYYSNSSKNMGFEARQDYRPVLESQLQALDTPLLPDRSLSH